jgi:hypothetical protein
MAEESGVLRPAVEVYLAGGIMTAEQIAVMRLYLQQWVCSPVWDRNPHASDEDSSQLAELRARVGDITTRKEIDGTIGLLTDLGMDPL